MQVVDLQPMARGIFGQPIGIGSGQADAQQNLGRGDQFGLSRTDSNWIGRDVIGWSGGAEGGGAEAYFELRFYGKPTDPMPWLLP